MLTVIWAASCRHFMNILGVLSWMIQEISMVMSFVHCFYWWLPRVKTCMLEGGCPQGGCFNLSFGPTCFVSRNQITLFNIEMELYLWISIEVWVFFLFVDPLRTTFFTLSCLINSEGYYTKNCSCYGPNNGHTKKYASTREAPACFTFQWASIPNQSKLLMSMFLQCMTCAWLAYSKISSSAYNSLR